MLLNNLEKYAIKMFVDSRNETNFDSKKLLDSVGVSERNFSEVGFITEIKPHSRPLLLASRENFTGGDIHIKLNGSIATGYVFYIKDGYLDAIEGHTYGGDLWPTTIHSFSVD